MPEGRSVRARSRGVIAAGLAGATLTLAGCAGAGGGGGPAEITFHMSKPEAVPYFRDLVEQFNAEQDEVQVTMDIASNLSAGFLRGNPALRT